MSSRYTIPRISSMMLYYHGTILICVKGKKKEKQWLCPIFWLLFEALLTRVPKPASNTKSVNVGLYGALTCIWHVWSIQMYNSIFYIICTYEYSSSNHYFWKRKLFCSLLDILRINQFWLFLADLGVQKHLSGNFT